MKYEILDDHGSVVNRIIADPDFVEQHYAGKYKLVDDQQERADKAAAEARTMRDRLLGDSDWVIVSSLESGKAVPADWVLYRQQLRDIPEQSGFPFDIDWPLRPSRA